MAKAAAQREVTTPSTPPREPPLRHVAIPGSDQFFVTRYCQVDSSEELNKEI